MPGAIFYKGLQDMIQKLYDQISKPTVFAILDIIASISPIISSLD